MRILSYLMRNGARSCLSFCACLLWAEGAGAEVTLIEKDGWSFSADGRINAFFSLGFGDDFPDPTPNPNGANGPTHIVTGGAGQETLQADVGNKYFTMRVRNGFVGSILGFALKRNVTPTTTAKGYIGLWSVIEGRRRSKLAFSEVDVREGYVNFDGPWGSLTAGRTLGLFGRISTEIDFLYGHNYGLGYPCGDDYGPTCGHIGTGVMFPGFAPGFLYSTPSLGGLKLHAGIYDPVRLLGAWNRAPIARPEAGATFEQKLSPTSLFKLGVEGVYQQVARVQSRDADGDGPIPSTQLDVKSAVWGAAGGGRLEVGPVRFGAAAFHGKGLGFYYALQNSPAVFDIGTSDLRTFTGLYAQAAVVLDKIQISAGAGRASVAQLPQDVVNALASIPKQQTGISAAVYYRVSDSFVLGLDYFRFMTDWYGVPNAVFSTDAMGNQITVPQAGILTPEKQAVNFVNAGATFHW